MEIKWQERYNIGVEIIDSQHQKLVSMINELGTAREDGRAKDVLKDILVNIVDYTQVHFTAEESHMAEHHYPILANHKAQHKFLIKQVVTILEEYKSGQTEVTDQLLKILQNWLIKHILDHDHQYGNYLKRIG